MDKLNSALTLLQTGFVPAILVGVTLWNSDKVISEAGAKALYEKIEQTSTDPSHSRISEAIESFLNDYFSFENGIWKFIVNVFLLTVVSLIILLSIYTYRTSGLFHQLLSKGFLLQFIGNGFVVTFAVNFFVLSTYRFLINSFVSGSISKNLLTVLADLTLKVVLFVMWTALTYVWFATIGNSFSGDPVKALQAVPVTISEAMRFRNLTSVYMYSLVMSSFPIFVVVLIKILVVDPRAAKAVRSLLFWLPFKFKPLRTISTIFAIFCGVLALLTSVLVTSLQSQ